MSLLKISVIFSMVKEMNKTILLVLDGFGIRNNENGNAIKLANTPYMDKFLAMYPNAILDASGESVGLPKGTPGNDAVGYLTIGCGRVIDSPLKKINDAIKDKSFYENKELVNTMEYVNKNDSSLHIVGLLSDGNNHGTLKHFYALLALAKLYEVKRVYFHLFTDGKDTNSKGIDLIKDFNEKLEKANLGTIGSLCGRYYAMDKDEKWDRIEKCYDLLVNGKGLKFNDPIACLKKHYDSGITDEFVNASIIDKSSVIKDNDAVIFTNLRRDGIKGLIDAFKVKDFDEFLVKKYENIRFCSLTELYRGIPCAFDNSEIKNSFGEYINGLDFKQVRISETESRCNVTYYFDGYQNNKYKLCDKFFISSPNVVTYDQEPQMSIAELTESIISAINDDADFILASISNANIIGHSGLFKPTYDSVEIIDFCLGKIHEEAKNAFYNLVITSSHGNAEEMLDNDSNVKIGNTTNKVPFIICNEKYKIKSSGTLADVMPTIIDLYEIKKPNEMKGESLILREE